MEHGFLIPIFSGSRVTRAVLQISKSRISDSTRKNFGNSGKIPESLTLGDYQFSLVCCNFVSSF